MNTADLHDLALLVRHDQLDVKIPALNEGIRQIRQFVDVVLDEFEKSDHRYFIYERLLNFGSMILELLKSLWRDSSNQECRTLAALIILEYDADFVASFLLEQLSPDNEYMCLIARKLAEANVAGVAQKIVECLRVLPLSQPHEILSLMNVWWWKIGLPLPGDIVEKLTDPAAPVDIKMYVDKMGL